MEWLPGGWKPLGASYADHIYGASQQSIICWFSGSWQVFWVRSVHNICIEHLWRDLTNSFGVKWKLFFQNLELHEGLDCDSNAHIWLLHHLFLDAINQNALEWAEAWNNHTITIHGERQRSPCDMFFLAWSRMAQEASIQLMTKASEMLTPTVLTGKITTTTKFSTITISQILKTILTKTHL